MDILAYEPGDLDDLMEIELASFTLPWSRRSYEELWPLDSIDIWIAKMGAETVGYYLIQRIGDEAELHTFAVKPDRRRQGIGSMLMEHMLAKARDMGTRFIYLQVRPSNAPARALYDRLGFRQVGVRRRYYRDNDEDAMVLRLEVT
ncbi:MAG: ribosomal protein S18-alanine N-acetyltransferase [Proteobacteria bacterium]|nr:ribosomal protein S18-alanine N-acetyltransferase [Pseudomonadota bacterium]